MSLLDLFAPGIGPLFQAINTVVDRVIPDKNAAEKLKNDIQKEMAEADVKGILAQLDIDKAEAASPSMFVAGWRPFIGWVCGAALAYQYVVAPIGMWAATWAGFHVPMPPKLDDVLYQLVFGMLGMGALRSFEKVSGVATKTIGVTAK